MAVDQKTKPPHPTGQKNTGRIFTLVLMVGFGMGVVASVIVFILLMLGGFFDGFLISDQVACESACPPLALELYNTLEAGGLLGDGDLVAHTGATEGTSAVEVITLTPSPTMTPTIDYAPTATAACATFSAQFPGTPCPTATATVTPTP